MRHAFFAAALLALTACAGHKASTSTSPATPAPIATATANPVSSATVSIPVTGMT